MAYHCMPAKEFLKLLLKTARLREAKRFLRINYDRMEVLDMLEVAINIEKMEKRK